MSSLALQMKTPLRSVTVREQQPGCSCFGTFPSPGRQALMKRFELQSRTCGTGSGVGLEGVRGQTDARWADSGQDVHLLLWPSAG